MPKPIEFIFVRHGQSQANADDVVNDGNSPLTALGVKQAKETAQALHGLGIEAIACSPLRRARQTAEIIANELGFHRVHITVISELRERGLGLLEGKPLDRKPVLYYSEEDDTLRFETRTALFERMKICLETLRSIATKQKTLVVGHSISGFYLLQIAAKKSSPHSFGEPPKMNNASFMKVTT